MFIGFTYIFLFLALFGYILLRIIKRRKHRGSPIDENDILTTIEFKIPVGSQPTYKLYIPYKFIWYLLTYVFVYYVIIEPLVYSIGRDKKRGIFKDLAKSIEGKAVLFPESKAKTATGIDESISLRKLNMNLYNKNKGEYAITLCKFLLYQIMFTTIFLFEKTAFHVLLIVILLVLADNNGYIVKEDGTRDSKPQEQVLH